MYNSSGMNSVAETMVKFEKELGLDSQIANPFAETREVLMEKFRDADVHVSHTYFPEWFKRSLTKTDYKLVWIGHGTPENIFNGSVEDGHATPYGMNDGLMLQQYYMQHADIIITHWERHAAIYRTQVDKKTPIHVVPMGIDKTFWKPVPSRGKFAGSPSLLYAENCHPIKWPFDMFITWPMVYPYVKGDATLHVTRLPQDLHRWFFPLVNRNGSAYASHISSVMWNAEDLRNSLCSVDYQIGLVLKGDFNRICLEAASCGCKTISYQGNPYSDFWLPEGDQREIAKSLISILNGNTPPRNKTPVPDARDTAVAMRKLYESA